MTSGGGARDLLRVAVGVFIHFLALGLSLAVLPLHVHDTLGLGPIAVGVVGGSQFAAALLTRGWAGAIADTRGPRRAMGWGVVAACAAGALYGASFAVTSLPNAALALLLAARALVGASESLLITGALTGGLGMVGVARAGQVMSWTGIALFGAYAVGAPLGTAVYSAFGFGGIAVATAAIPLAAWAWLARLRLPAPTATGAVRPPFYRVLRAVWLPGLGLTFAAVGFGTITTFVALLFSGRGWAHAALAITAFGAAFVVARLFFGDWPDRFGGARVALASVAIEACGQALVAFAQEPAWAHVGAALTGFGYSLAFPAFGVEAVRRAPPQSRGAAMGAYVAFLDLSLGVSGPLAGVLAGAAGIASVYGAGALAAVASAWVAIRLLRPAA